MGVSRVNGLWNHILADTVENVSHKLLLPLMVSSRPFLTVSLPARPSQNSAIQESHSPKSHYFSGLSMQGSGPAACCLERAICIFYVTGNLCTSTGVLLEEEIQFHMVGLLRPLGKTRRGGSRGGQLLGPAGISQAAVLSLPVGGAGGQLLFCCLFRLAVCCPGA